MSRFTEALRARAATGFVPVIPDIKCISPKEGDILRGRDPVKCALELAKAGAPVLSVVTESENFGGSLDLLRQIAEATKLPVLRKDFISSEEDIKLTAEAGAAALLLICSTIERDNLKYLYNLAVQYGLEPLVEAHTEEELEFADSLGARLVGINNRDILQLERDSGNVETTASLANRKPAESLLISESGISSEQDVRKAISSGADAVLVGTALWQAEDLSTKYRQLSSARHRLKICGLMKTEDVDLCLELGVDILGFVTEYPLDVPWNLSRADTASLMARIHEYHQDDEASISAENHIERKLSAHSDLMISPLSCIVTGGDPESVIKLAEELRPNLVQLHYHETIADTKIISQRLNPIGIGVIKTIPSDASARMEQFGTADLEAAVRMLNETDVFAVLADMRSAANAAQNGLELDLEFCRSVAKLSDKPVMIGGGLRPDTMMQALENSGAVFADIMTGVEIEPGTKSAKLVRQAMAVIKR